MKYHKLTIDNEWRMRYNHREQYCRRVFIYAAACIGKDVASDKMTVKKFRTFFSVAAEEKFLNKMGANGFLLVGTRLFLYIFEKTEKIWSYSAEWLNSSPDTEENKKYISSKCAGEGVEYCGKKNCFAYFAKEGNFPPEKSYGAKYNIKKRYRSLSWFWTVVSAYMTGLTIYNIVWVGKFNDIGYVIHDDKEEILRYFKFIVGKNPASLFLILLIPLTSIILLMTAACWAEYISWMKKCPKSKKTKTEIRTLTEAEIKTETEAETTHEEP